MQDMEASDYFRVQAHECRRLAEDLAMSRDKDGLLMLARHYDGEARRAAAGPPAPILHNPA